MARHKITCKAIIDIDGVCNCGIEQRRENEDNKRNKWFIGGCDSCGEQKLVRNHKGGKQGNWQKVIVCNDCVPERSL